MIIKNMIILLVLHLARKHDSDGTSLLTNGDVLLFGTYLDCSTASVELPDLEWGFESLVIYVVDLGEIVRIYESNYST